MAYKVYDYECPECGNIEERLNKDGEMEVCGEPIECGAEHTPGSVCRDTEPCPGVMHRIVSGAAMHTVNKKNSDFAQRERERLVKRSNDHWKREGRDEAHEKEKAQRRKAERAL